MESVLLADDLVYTGINKAKSQIQTKTGWSEIAAGGILTTVSSLILIKLKMLVVEIYHTQLIQKDSNISLSKYLFLFQQVLLVHLLN